MSAKLFRPLDEVKSGFESLSPEFERLLAPAARVNKLWGAGIWTEGPTYLPKSDCVVFSDIPNDRALSYDCQTGRVATFAQPANYPNGHATDLEGRLIACEHGERRVTRREDDGARAVIADNYRGKRLNSPNDVAVKSDGSIWFTDPPYGIIDPTQGHPAESELDGCFVFRFDPRSGELTIVADELERPNGLVFAPAEDVLYISDTGKAANIVAFKVAPSGDKLSAPREFARPRPGKADGMCVNRDGVLFSSAWDGVQAFAPNGDLLGKILVPEQRTSNCVFGGKDGCALFITATGSLYSARLKRGRER